MSAKLHFARPDDRRFSQVLSVWRANGVKEAPIAVYAAWVRRFLTDCRRRGRDPDACITWSEIRRFVERRVGPRGGRPSVALPNARSALRAWSWGLAACGYEVPCWRPQPGVERIASPLLREFIQHRLQVRGVAASTTARDTDVLRGFLAFLHDRRRSPARVRLADVDAYVVALRERFAPRTVQRVCCSIRAFLRFLVASGRHRHDLAPSVLAPWQCRDAYPPRALPWKDVRRILASIDRSTRLGLRDHALLLLMAAYGLGAAEAFALRMEDIDWRRGILRVVRPKTGREIVLPLLGPVARSLAAYLRRARPRHTAARNVFVEMHAPFGPYRASGAARHVLVKHARAAGVSATFLGSHALRHSHATRQIDLGAPAKVVGDVLGHVRPSSTSVYVRVALRRLRALALPVPS